MTLTNNAPDDALDVWLAFAEPPADVDEDYDDEAEYEANTYHLGDERGDWFRVKWCHTGVGLVRARDFDTYEQAREWLESEGFQDFTVED